MKASVKQSLKNFEENYVASRHGKTRVLALGHLDPAAPKKLRVDASRAESLKESFIHGFELMLIGDERVDNIEDDVLWCRPG